MGDVMIENHRDHLFSKILKLEEVCRIINLLKNFSINQNKNFVNNH